MQVALFVDCEAPITHLHIIYTMNPNDTITSFEYFNADDVENHVANVFNHNN